MGGGIILVKEDCMNAIEQKEIMELPDKYRPLGAWAYFGYSLLFAIPFIGFIFLLVFSFSSGNINRRSFARSYFCIYIVIAVVLLIVIFAFGINFAMLFDSLKNATGR